MEDIGCLCDHAELTLNSSTEETRDRMASVDMQRDLVSRQPVTFPVQSIQQVSQGPSPHFRNAGRLTEPLNM